MSRILSPESHFFDDFLFNRYETIRSEVRPGGSFLPFERLGEPLLLSDMLAADQPELHEFHRHWLDITRLEPENPYVVHTSVPSARGLQSNLMLLALRSGGRKLWFVYLKEEQQFAFIREEPSEDPEEEAYSCYAIYNHRTVGRYYGRFGFLLSLLDTGHQLHHFERLAEAFGFENIKIEFLPALERIPACADGVPMMRMTFSPPNPLLFREAAYSERIIGRSSQQEQPGERSFYELLDRLRGDQSRIQRHSLPEVQELGSYLELVSKRTSLQSHEGLGFFRERNLPLEKLAGRLRSKLKGGEIDVLLIDPVTREALRVGDGQRIPNPFDNPDLLLHDSAEYLDPNSASCLLLTLLKQDAGLTDKQRLFAYIRSAEVMSEASLYFAEQGLVARCLRNIDDHYILAKLDGYEQVTYLQIAGENVLNRKLHL